MNTYDYYGISAKSIEEAVDFVSKALCIKFEKHGSGAAGLYYLSQQSQGSDYRVIPNFDGDIWREKDYMESPYILQCNRIASTFFSMDEFKGRLRFIRRSEVQAKRYLRSYHLINGDLVLVAEKNLEGLRWNT